MIIEVLSISCETLHRNLKMSVVIETTIGDLTVDLFLRERPRACQNFLKLCKLKYYNFCLFHTVQRDFIAQTGDPEGTGKGGSSLYGILYGEQAKYFEAEKTPKLKHHNTGTLSFASHGDHMLGSQFFLTLGEQLEYLDGDHCVFGQVVEGLDVLLKLNAAICDDKYQPYQDIRITHTVVLDDPLDDPAGLEIPDRSPPLTDAILNSGRIAADEDLEESAGRTAEELEELIEEREARARATILEMVGDLPEADSAPPENVLFVCKLNPVTTDDDLQIIFSRFGKVVSCEIIRDQKTGNSLQYGFIEFDNPKSCENAYFKMDNVLIDDRRIHVDFSQSVSKVKWRGKGRITYESGTAAGDLANMGGGGGGGGRRDRGRGQRGHHHGTGRPQAPRPAPGRPGAEADSRSDRTALSGLNVGQLKALLGDGRKKRDGSGDSSDDNRPSKKSKKHKKGSRKHSSDRNNSSDDGGPVGKEKPKDRRRRSPHSSDQRLQRKEAHDRRRSRSPDAGSFRKQDSRDKKRRSQSPDVRASRTDDSRIKRRRSPSQDRKWSRRDDSRSKNRRSRSPAVGPSRKEEARNRRRSPSPGVGHSRTENSRDRRDRRRTPDPDVRSSTREDRDRLRRSPDPDERERVPKSSKGKVREDKPDKTSHKKKKHRSDGKARKKKGKRRRSRSSDSDSSSDSSSGEDRRKKSSRRR